MSKLPNKTHQQQLLQARLQQQGRLGGNYVQMGEKLQIKGDQERRDQLEHTIELKAEETLRQAQIQAREMVESAQQQAQDILRSAQEEAAATAQSIVEAAQAEEENIRTAATEAGYQAGFEAGQQQITADTEAEIANLLLNAKTLLEGAYEAEKRVLKAIKPDAHKLINHVTQRIVGEAVEANPEARLDLIDRAVESLYLSGTVKLVVHPELLASLRRYTAGTKAAVDALNRFEFMTDELLNEQQIFILSEQGSFEITPALQVDHLLDAVQKGLNIPKPEDLPAESLNEGAPSVLAENAPLEPTEVPSPELSAPDLSAADTQDSITLPQGDTPEADEAAASEFVSFDDLDFETFDFDDDGALPE